MYYEFNLPGVFGRKKAKKEKLEGDQQVTGSTTTKILMSPILWLNYHCNKIFNPFFLHNRIINNFFFVLFRMKKQIKNIDRSKIHGARKKAHLNIGQHNIFTVVRWAYNKYFPVTGNIPPATTTFEPLYYPFGGSNIVCSLRKFSIKIDIAALADTNPWSTNWILSL